MMILMQSYKILKISLMQPYKMLKINYTELIGYPE